MEQITLQGYFMYVHRIKVLSQLSRESEVLVFKNKESYFVEAVTILQKSKRMLIAGLIEIFLLIFCCCIAAGSAFFSYALWLWNAK